MKPVLQALVLAEHIYEDKTGKKIICGTFNAVKYSHASPVKEISAADGTNKKVIAGGTDGGSPWAYISLTDVWDNTDLELQFVSLRQNKAIFRTGLRVQCTDRLATVEIVVPLPRLFVPESGTYAFEVMCEGEVLGSHRIRFEEITETQSENDPGT